MSKALRVAKYDAAVAALLERADALGVYAIARLQDSKGRSLLVNNGKLERIDTGSLLGIGVQVFTQEGFTGFVSSDQVTPESCRELVETAAKLARSASSFGTEANRAVFEIESNGTQVVATDYRTLEDTSYDDQVKTLLEINQQAQAFGQGLSVRSGHSLSDPHWRIVRSDGTDISFDTPHASTRSSLTVSPSAGSRAATVGAGVSGADASVLLDAKFQELLDLRTRKATDLVQQLVNAPQMKGGHYKLVIDYALAKGLAHEAFGHASETDGMETSILGNNGKMRIGEQMAASMVTITDGPVLGDYAYQPISANGMPRQTVEILKNGILQAGLGDLFSAGKAAVPISGAERIETYRNLPLPRMSNIRITVDHPISLDTRFELVTPAELRQVLIQNNLMSEGEQVIYLAGYKGGQVNPKDGDFMFNCVALYDLSQADLPLYQPGVFSGKILAALFSILAGVGSVYLDAMGSCGKGGQSVPSSGGSHSFLVLDRNEDITIGGSN